MDRPNLVQVENRIVNLNTVQYVEIEDHGNLVNVHLMEGQMLQFVEAEAHSLLGILESGYVRKGLAEGAGNELLGAFESAIKK